MKIEPIAFKGEDERGATTELDTLDRNGPYILAYRNKGYWSGNHYHKGLSKFKNPEVVFLLQGKVLLETGEVEDGRISSIDNQEIESPARIEIKPYIWHKLTFLEDACFFELNSFKEGDRDTFRVVEQGKGLD
ncbi:MAG: hypothetical protein GC180_02690 [Bacteroidetes bacterium]|nr:hypothetical protein [Bacteroidota bacterium]